MNYPTVRWPIGQGQHLAFDVFDPLSTQWNRSGGLYVFAKRGAQGWNALYTGETSDFSARLPRHEKWPTASARGATHIHALVEEREATRLNLERRLIQTLRPPLNVQHVNSLYG